MIKYFVCFLYLAILIYLFFDLNSTKLKLTSMENSITESLNNNQNDKIDSESISKNDVSKQMLSFEKRISYIERKLIISNNSKDNKKETENDQGSISEKYDNASDIIEKASENGEFTINDVRTINKIMTELSDSDRISIENRIIDLIRNNGIEMPKPDPSEVKDIAIDEKDVPVNAIKVSP